MKDYIGDIKHIAIIMDGNGRWAQKRSLIRTKGHQEGIKTLEEIIMYAKKINLKYLTVYAFSTENWKRPKLEVSTLMELFKRYLIDKKEKFKKENIRLVISGSEEKLSKDLIKEIKKTEEFLKDCDGLVLNIAFNYGSRIELVETLNYMVKNNLEINEENISANLYNSFIPNPDLLIRTGSEFRLSNFLLWQLAYSEIYISDKLWPDFKKEDLQEAIDNYLKRNRRYGGL